MALEATIEKKTSKAILAEKLKRAEEDAPTIPSETDKAKGYKHCNIHSKAASQPCQDCLPMCCCHFEFLLH